MKPIIRFAAHAQDRTQRALEQLKGKGYDTVTWVAGEEACDKCQDAAANADGISIDDFVFNLAHNAPMADHAHPDDKGCHLKVSSSENATLPVMRVLYNGSIREYK